MSKKKNKRREAFRRRTAPGAPPGAIVIDPCASPPVMRVLAYDGTRVADEQIGKPEDLHAFLGKFPVTWVNVEGLGDARTITDLGKVFGLQP